MGSLLRVDAPLAVGATNPRFSRALGRVRWARIPAAARRRPHECSRLRLAHPPPAVMFEPVMVTGDHGEIVVARWPAVGSARRVIDIGNASGHAASGRTTCAVAGRDPRRKRGTWCALGWIARHRRERRRAHIAGSHYTQSSDDRTWHLLDSRPACGAQQSAVVVGNSVPPPHMLAAAGPGR